MVAILFSRRNELPFPVQTNVSDTGSHVNIWTKVNPPVSALYPTSSLQLIIRRTVWPSGRLTALWIMTRLRLSTYVLGILMGSPQRRWMSFSTDAAWKVLITG